MKLLFSILLFLNLQAFSQYRKLEISINLNPELAGDLINEKFNLIIFTDSFEKRTSYIPNQTLLIDSFPNSQGTIFITCHKKYDSLSISKFFLSVFPIDSTNQSLTKISFKFPRECENYKYIKNKTCPKCHKKNKVIPIIYGLIVPIYSEDGKLIEPKGEYYSGTCTEPECSPSWYCKRDKLTF